MTEKVFRSEIAAFEHQPDIRTVYRNHDRNAGRHALSDQAGREAEPFRDCAGGLAACGDNPGKSGVYSADCQFCCGVLQQPGHLFGAELLDLFYLPGGI